LLILIILAQQFIQDEQTFMFETPTKTF